MAEEEELKITRFQKSRAQVVHRSEIKNAPYNPRQIKQTNKRRLTNGIKKHGLVGTVTWNKRTGNVVGGHRRLESIDELEKSEDYHLEVSVIDVPIEKERAINLLLNNRRAQGEDNLIKLQSLLEVMDEEGTDFEDAGFTRVDIQNIFPDAFAEGEVAEQLEAEAPSVETLTEFKNAGKEEDAGFREQMDQFKKDNPDEFSEPEEQGNDTPRASDEPAAESSAETSEPAAEQPTEQPAEPGTDWKHSKEYFKDHRKRTEDNNRDFANESDVVVSLFFQTQAQLIAFLNAHRMDQSKRNFDVFNIEEAFGIELPR